jgi:hypothetical protein
VPSKPLRTERAAVVFPLFRPLFCRWFRPLLVSLVGLVLLSAGPARAQVPGEELRVSNVTFGAGLHPFYKFGHNAILIENPQGQNIIYNFGMFDFGSPALLPKFLLGRYMYWLARTERDRTIAHYVEENRTVEIQELNLPPAQRRALLDRLEHNALPQNRHYLYDYFYDNCSTRVRDAIDASTGGRLRAGSQSPARYTFRQQALALTADLPWLYVTLYFALGQGADRPITRWEEGFVPMQLRDQLRQVKIPSETGGEQPLVKSERVVYRSTRPDLPSDPPRRLGLFATFGIVAGALAALVGWLAASRRWARVALGAGSATLGLVLGLLGTVLVFLWAATDHRAAHANANILQAAPWTILLAGHGIKLARGRSGAGRKAFFLVAAAAVASILGLLGKGVGLLFQENGPVIAFFLPLWLGLALGLALYAGIRLPTFRRT